MISVPVCSENNGTVTYNRLLPVIKKCRVSVRAETVKGGARWRRSVLVGY